MRPPKHDKKLLYFADRFSMHQTGRSGRVPWVTTNINQPKTTKKPAISQPLAQFPVGKK